MCTYPWWMTRFSPRFLNALRGAFLPPSPFLSPFFSPASGAAASAFAMCYAVLNRLLLRDRALARPLPGAGVRLGALAVHGEIPAVAQAPVAADFHQPLDVHGDLLAEIAFHAAHVLEHAADLADVVL